MSSFKNLYDEKYANFNLTFFRESQNAGRERFAKEPQKNSVAKAFAKVEFLVHVVLFMWVTIFLCRQPQQASQPASQPQQTSQQQQQQQQQH